jgi:hypothetical protein
MPVRDISEVTKEELMKDIHRECLGCSAQKEWKIHACDYIQCPLHKYLGFHSVEMAPPKKEKIIDTDEPKKGKK